MTSDEPERKRKLLLVTIDIIAEKGATKTTLRDIATAASLSQAAVLYHYSTKEVLLRAAHDLVWEALTDHLRVCVEDSPSPRAAVGAYVAARFQYLADHPTHRRVVVAAVVDRIVRGGAAIEQRDHCSVLTDLISRAQAAGEYASVLDARSNAVVLTAAVDALAAEATLLDADDRDGRASVLLSLVSTLSSAAARSAPPT